ncbi:restriction endonuclease subunit S [Phormidium tenue FACHB-886]|nr:restriction endonuclease subunit S [Phormidium tenue FACHB-886]
MIQKFTADLPSDWNIIRLDNLAEIVSGVTKGRKLEGRSTICVPYLRVANVQAGHLDLKEIKEIEVSVDEVEKFRLKPGDVVMTEGGDRDKLGRGAVWQGEVDLCLHQNHIFRVRPKIDILDPYYLEAYLGSPEAQTYFLRCAKQTTGIASINMTQLRAFPVLLPPIAEQRRIAAILDRADAVRRKRQEAIALTEELLRSAFLEMFGDPVTNPKGWKVVLMKDVVSQTQYGTAEKANSERIGIPVLRMNNITYTGEINLDDIKWCSIASEDKEKFTVQRSDLLFNRTNSPELVGKTAVWRSDEEYAYAGYLVRVRFKKGQALSEYVSAYLNSSYGKKYLFERAKPSNNMSNFSASEFLKIPLPLPPFDLQQRFVLLADSARLSMNRLEGIVKDADNLFNSLLQRAFRGEL